MPGPVGRLGSLLAEVYKLIAEIDKGHAVVATAQLELEQTPVEFQRRLDISHLEGDVVDSHRPRLIPMIGHRCFLSEDPLPSKNPESDEN